MRGLHSCEIRNRIAHSTLSPIFSQVRAYFGAEPLEHFRDTELAAVGDDMVELMPLSDSWVVGIKRTGRLVVA